MTVPALPERPAPRHVRPLRPLHFPVSAEVPESKRHLRMRTALFQLLELHFSDVARIGSDQFMYFDASDPAAVVAPDVFLALGGPDEEFNSWKVWERGAPDIAIEVISHSDHGQVDWDAKLLKYLGAGVRELVRFEPVRSSPGIRVWDRIGDDLIERVGLSGIAECLPLGLYWVTDQRGPFPQLRLSTDGGGRHLLPTHDELTRQSLAREEHERQAKERERRAKERALSRIAELERALRDRGE